MPLLTKVQHMRRVMVVSSSHSIICAQTVSFRYYRNDTYTTLLAVSKRVGFKGGRIYPYRDT